MSDVWKFLAPDGKAERARARRRAFPIHAYVGRNGSAKSLAMIYDTLPDMVAGKEILSTVRLVDWMDPRPCEGCDWETHGAPGHLAAYGGWVPFKRWPELLEFKHGPILMDEIVGVADSAESGRIPGAVRKKLQELRRDECVVRMTGLAWMRIPKRLREAVKAVTRCQSFMPITVQDDNGEDLIWRQRRLAVWRTYDADSLPVDDHSEAAYEKADLLCKGKLWIPSSPAGRAYVSTDPVLRVGSIDESGLCSTCEGTKRSMECSCPEYQSEKKARRAGSAQGRSPRTGPAPRPLLAEAQSEESEGAA